MEQAENLPAPFFLPLIRLFEHLSAFIFVKPVILCIFGKEMFIIRNLTNFNYVYGNYLIQE